MGANANLLLSHNQTHDNKAHVSVSNNIVHVRDF